MLDPQPENAYVLRMTFGWASNTQRQLFFAGFQSVLVTTWLKRNRTPDMGA
jgi:hypothetical protein